MDGAAAFTVIFGGKTGRPRPGSWSAIADVHSWSAGGAKKNASLKRITACTLSNDNCHKRGLVQASLP